MNNARQAVGIPTISPIEAVAEMACDDGKKALGFFVGTADCRLRPGFDGRRDFSRVELQPRHRQGGFQARPAPCVLGDTPTRKQ